MRLVNPDFCDLAIPRGDSQVKLVGFWGETGVARAVTGRDSLEGAVGVGVTLVDDIDGTVAAGHIDALVGGIVGEVVGVGGN